MQTFSDLCGKNQKVNMTALSRRKNIKINKLFLIQLKNLFSFNTENLFLLLFELSDSKNMEVN